MRFVLIIILSCTSLFCYANDTGLNETLVRIIQQINAIQPLLDEAKLQADPNERIQFHVEAFEAPDGKQHPGLRNDLLAIRGALIGFINHPVIVPRVIEPLALDFTDKP